jgi:hypothetical protein
MAKKTPKPPVAVMILGVGSFAHSIGKALADAGRGRFDLSDAQLRPLTRQRSSEKPFRATHFRVRFR